MSAAETHWVTLPDGLVVKAVVNTAKPGVATITIVTCLKQEGYDCLDPDAPFGSLSAGRCTRRNSRLWDVALYRRAADPRDAEALTTPTLHELGAVLGDRLRAQGAWWQ